MRITIIFTFSNKFWSCCCCWFISLFDTKTISHEDVVDAQEVLYAPLQGVQEVDEDDDDNDEDDEVYSRPDQEYSKTSIENEQVS